MTLTAQAGSINNAATGGPSIWGTAQVDSTLTADTAGITDDDGLTSPTYTYQWIRVDADGSSNPADVGANSSTYTLVDDDDGKKIKLKVTFQDDDSNNEELTSEAYPSGASTVAGDSRTVPADWGLIPSGLGAGDSFRLIFLTSTKSDLTSASISDYNTFVQERAANGHTAIQDYSGLFKVVGSTEDVDARDNTNTLWTTADLGVKIFWLNGTQVADHYWDFYNGDWDDEANNKNESGIDGQDTSQVANNPATGSEHDGTEDFSGSNSRALGASQIRVGKPNSTPIDHGPLSSSNNAGSTDTRPLYALSDVLTIISSVSGDVTITGAAHVGSTLTADTSSIEDTDGLTTPGYEYQWIRVDADGTSNPTDIGTDSSTYTLVADDEGKKIKVKVTFTDDASNGEELTSDAYPSGADTVIADTGNVPDHWGLIPDGLGIGDSFRLIFLTSTKTVLTSTDIATYNTFVQNLAAAGHTDIQDYSASFKVVGSTAAVDARDNTDTTHTSSEPGVPIYWLNGNKVADNYADFYDGSWDEEHANRTESGTAGEDTNTPGEFPATGSNHDGTEKFVGSDSRALGATTVQVARPDNTGTGNGPLSSDNNAANSQTRLLYALSDVLTVVNTVSGEPTITGAAQVNRTLGVDTSAIMDTDGLTSPGYTYDWYRIDQDLTNTVDLMNSSSTYTLTDDDLAKRIEVIVEFTDDANQLHDRRSPRRGRELLTRRRKHLVHDHDRGVPAGGKHHRFKARIRRKFRRRP